jgi:hypothetical protein
VNRSTVIKDKRAGKTCDCHERYIINSDISNTQSMMFKVWNDAQKGRHVTERDFRIERRDEKEKHKRGCRSMQVRHLDFRRARWVFIVYRLFLMPPSAKISWSVRETYYTDAGSCMISKMYVFRVIPSNTAVNSRNSISSA